MQFSNKVVCVTLVALLAGSASVMAQVSQETIDSLSAPDKLDTSIGTLEFDNGAPTADTAEKVRDALLFTRALNVFNNSFRGASALALKKGFESASAEPNDIIIFSELMDAESLFLTANADTVYYIGTVDLSTGRARDHQRHVVLLGHRHRPARPRPRSRWKISHRRAGI